MRPTASHRLYQITMNVNSPPGELCVWNKLMKNCINIKLKVTKLQSANLLLLKLRSKNQGTNSISHTHSLTPA